MSTPHVFTVEEWHQMGSLDAFGEDARVELRNPCNAGYRSAEPYRRGDTITIEALPHLRVAVADVVAPAD